MLTMCSDEQLLGMIGCGEKDAFEELYRRYAPMIRNVLRTYLFSAEDLLDLLQEVTLQLWQKRPRLILHAGMRVAGSP